MSVEDADALYYPYVHVRDVGWLKRNLLLFPRVCRMVPAGFDPGDDEEIREFVRAKGSRGLPFLDRADLMTGGVYNAVMALTKKFDAAINQDKEGMVTRFGQEAADADPKRDPKGFQYQVEKVPDLSQILQSAGLAWTPRFREPTDPASHVEVHRRVGEAVMTTLALACASDEGLQVVTNDQPLNRCLAEGDIEGVFDAWIIRGDGESLQPPESRERKLAIAVFECADVSKVTPTNLKKLHEAWEPRMEFLKKIRELAETVPSMKKASREQERFQDLAGDVIKTWEKERKRLGLSDIFPSVAGDSVKEVGKNFLERFLVPATVGGAAAAPAVPEHGWLSVGVGVAIGVVAEGVKTVVGTRMKAANSPFRYLTLTEKAGVSYSVGV
jgi:hypothetical protein